MPSEYAQVAWNLLRAVLPYPDLPRRVRMRHRAFGLVTLQRWPGDDAATGDDAAQLALLRALHLQRLTRRAARYRQREEAALLARTAIDNALVGLYCLHNDDSVRKLTGGEHLALRRITAYLTHDDDGLFSRQALLDGADALGERGSDLNLKDVAQGLSKDNDLPVAMQLYEGYYAPLSHFFQHSSGFALMRYVRANGKLRHRPAFPWTQRSAVRVADCCAGYIAWAIASKSGVPAAGLLRYAKAHQDRMLTPTFVITSKGWMRAIGWRNLVRMLRAFTEFRRYVHGAGSGASAAEQEEYIRKQFADILNVVAPGVPDAATRPIIDELVGKLLAAMNPPPGDPPDTVAPPDAASAA
jgi:hypothetical protein